MKRFFSMFFALCALVTIICLSATTVFAAEEPVTIELIDVLLDDLVPGKPLPTPTVPEGAPYEISKYQWLQLHVGSIHYAESTEDVTGTMCENGHRYKLKLTLVPVEGYKIDSQVTKGVINGSLIPNELNRLVFQGSFDMAHVWSLRTQVNRVELGYQVPPAGSETKDFELTCLTPGYRIGEISVFGSPTVFEDHKSYIVQPNIIAADGYEFSKDVEIFINGEQVERRTNRWDVCSSLIYLDYDQKISAVEFPAWPETAQIGAGGVAELTVPEGANYRLTQGWVDMRSGQIVENLAAGNVYNLAYVAIPENGFHFTDETVFTLGGETVHVMGSEQYAVIYKTYDLGATKIDRVEVTTPVFIKGYAPGSITVGSNAPYEVTETAWCESTTGKFADAVGIEAPSFHTSIFAISVLAAKDGYIFADEVKLFVNGQEVAVEYFYSMGNVVELAGYAGTLTPPATDGWHKEDNTWAYYQGGEKVKNTWMKDSIGWVYLDENGLMVKNGFAEDSKGICYLGTDGYMLKNCWVQHKNGWYCMDKNGYMVKNSWVRDHRDWCYVGADGKMYTDTWVRDSVGWCYVGSDGYMVRNVWAADSYGICRLDANGYMIINRWVHDGYGWAYLDKRGYALEEGWMADSKGWCYIRGYYMVTNRWAKDSKGMCRMGPDGYMLKNQWVRDGHGWAYVDADGYAVFNQFVNDSKGTCYLGADGYMVKNRWVWHDGGNYYLDGNGYVTIRPYQ